MSSKAPVWRYGGPIGFHLPEVAVIPNGVGGMFGVEEEASRMPELPATPFLIIRWGRINWKEGLGSIYTGHGVGSGCGTGSSGNDNEACYIEGENTATP